MHKTRWSDLEFVLAVAKEGSAAAAARALGVNHATVIRRIQNFEAQWSNPIFEHRRDGYRLTEKGEVFLEAAETIGEALADLQRKAAGNEEKLGGHVRITTTDSVFPILVREVPALKRAYPDILLDLTISNQRLDLFNREADIALRPSHQPPSDLVGRKVGVLAFGLYRPADTDPTTPLQDLPWLALDNPLLDSTTGRRVSEYIEKFEITARADSFVSLAQLAEEGVGCAFMPCHLGDASDRLVRVQPAPMDLDVDVWLLSHKDILRARRVRACVDFLYGALKKRFLQTSAE